MFGKVARRHTRSYSHLTQYNIYCNETIKKYTLSKESEKNQGCRPQKVINNLMWVNAAIENSQKTKKYKVLYIDGPDARTTRVLMDAGYSAADCIAVNNDASTVKKLTKFATDTRAATFKDRINKPLSGISAIWYDGCATYRGTDTLSPSNDINMLLTHNLNNTVLAITFSARSKERISKNAVIDEIETTIKQHGYKIDTVHTVGYKPSMCFWMALLKHEDMPLL